MKNKLASILVVTAFLLCGCNNKEDHRKEPDPPVINTYTITFDSNGGSGTISSITKEENSYITLPSCTFTAPSDKEFDYWSINSIHYNEGQSYKLISDVTCYANWKDTEVDPPGSWEDDKYYLSECGYYNMGIPINSNNPVEIRTTLSADSSSWFNSEFISDTSNGYRYIYKNSCSDGPSGHYTSVKCYDNEKGGFKIDDLGVGFGSPYFNHSGAKLELRLGISQVNNAKGDKDPDKDTYHIYFFGENNNYLGKSSVPKGSINTSTKELTVYYTEPNAINVKYFELRVICKPYVSSQSYNVGISYCNIKSWERV